MQKGTVKFFNENKGFGFIRSESGEDVFVHANGLRDNISENDQVVFELEQSRRGPQAVKVARVS